MNEGALKKKTKNKLTFEHIKESFLKKVPECGIVAYFMKYVKEEKDKEMKTVFQYFDEKEFSTLLINLFELVVEFIDKKNQLYNGILQRFIQPKGDHNCINKINMSQV